jgi:GR25 family glycosyltransferase involved in LPS biosynthesis
LLNYVSKFPGYSVIFEDDVQIPTGFQKTVEQIIQDVPDFDIIYLGNLDGNHKHQVVRNVYTVDSESYLTGTHAYLVKNENTWKITNQLKYQKAIDLELSELIKQGHIEGFVVWPSLASQKPSPSSIRNGEERVTVL